MFRISRYFRRKVCTPYFFFMGLYSKTDGLFVNAEESARVSSKSTTRQIFVCNEGICIGDKFLGQIRTAVEKSV